MIPKNQPSFSQRNFVLFSGMSNCVRFVEVCLTLGTLLNKKACPKTGFDPPLPCATRSFEYVLLHVELAGRLSTSIQGMSATTQTRPLLITVQGLLPITNRAGKLFFQRTRQIWLYFSIFIARLISSCTFLKIPNPPSRLCRQILINATRSALAFPVLSNSHENI